MMQSSGCPVQLRLRCDGQLRAAFKDFDRTYFFEVLLLAKYNDRNEEEALSDENLEIVENCRNNLL